MEQSGQMNANRRSNTANKEEKRIMRQEEEKETNDGSRRNVLVNEWIEKKQNIKGAWNRETGPKERDAGSIGRSEYAKIFYGCV